MPDEGTKTYDAVLVGFDRSQDLAVLKISAAPDELVPMRFFPCNHDFLSASLPIASPSAPYPCPSLTCVASSRSSELECIVSMPLQHWHLWRPKSWAVRLRHWQPLRAFPHPYPRDRQWLVKKHPFTFRRPHLWGNPGDRSAQPKRVPPNRPLSSPMCTPHLSCFTDAILPPPQ